MHFSTETAFPVKTASKERPVPSGALVPTAFPDCRENPVVEVNLDVTEKTSQESLANKENVVNLVMLEYLDTQDDQVRSVSSGEISVHFAPEV